MTAIAPTPPAFVPELGFPITQGPYTGMRDSGDPSTADPLKAKLIQNMYPEDPQLAGAVVGRPGFAVAGSQLGATTVRNGQLVFQFTKKDGTEYTIVIVGGKFHTYDWSGDSFTEVLTASNLSTASVTLSTTAQVYAVTFNDEVVISDGVNTPFAWDGTTNGGITKMTNAPVFFGQPQVYYGKLCGIKDADRLTWVYSEELAVNTGYEAGVFNNSWTVGQTNQGGLVRLHATNEALYYFREQSSGTILGEITTNFSSTGTKDGLSETVGTKSPAGVVSVGSDMWLMDAQAYVWYVPVGGKPIPVYSDHRVFSTNTPKSTLTKVVALYWKPGNLVLFGVQSLSASTDIDSWLCFNALTHQFCGVWRGYGVDTAAMVLDGNAEPTLMHIEAGGGSTGGYVYKHGLPDGSVWDDAIRGTNANIAHVVEGSAMAYDTYEEKTFTRVDVVMRLRGATQASLSYQTTRGAGVPQNMTLSGGDVSLWDVFQWDDDKWSGEEYTSHESVGINAQGVRWLIPRVQHSEAGEEFGLLQMTAWHGPVGGLPGTP